jgi:hypothetical protein
LRNQLLTFAGADGNVDVISGDAAAKFLRGWYGLNTPGSPTARMAMEGALRLRQ